MKRFKFLVLILLVAIGVTACSGDKAPDENNPETKPGQESGNGSEKDQVPDSNKDNLTGNELLRNIYENRAKKVSYDAIAKAGDMEISSKYYIDGENYRIETDGYISIYNSEEDKLYSYDSKTMEGTIQVGEQTPGLVSEFQEIEGLKVAEIRDYEGSKELYVESVGESEGKEFKGKSWLSKKYYINLKSEGIEDGKVVSTVESSNITEDFDSEEIFKKPEGVDFKEAK